MTDTIPLSDAILQWGESLRILALQHPHLDDDHLAKQFKDTYRKLVEDIQTQFNAPRSVIIMAMEQALMQFRFESGDRMTKEDSERLARYVASYLIQAEAIGREIDAQRN